MTHYHFGLFIFDFIILFFLTRDTLRVMKMNSKKLSRISRNILWLFKFRHSFLVLTVIQYGLFSWLMYGDMSRDTFEKYAYVLPYLDLREQSLVNFEPKQALIQSYITQDSTIGEKKIQIKFTKGYNLRGRSFRFAQFYKALLINSDLRYAILQGAVLRNVDLSGAKLQGADLSGAILHDTRLLDANLHLTNLQRANLSYANLQGADLWGADLSHAKLQCVNLSGTDLSGADLSKSQLEGSILSISMQSTRGIKWPNSPMILIYNPIVQKKINQFDDSANFDSLVMKADIQYSINFDEYKKRILAAKNKYLVDSISSFPQNINVITKPNNNFIKIYSNVALLNEYSAMNMLLSYENHSYYRSRVEEPIKSLSKKLYKSLKGKDNEYLERVLKRIKKKSDKYEYKALIKSLSSKE